MLRVRDSGWSRFRSGQGSALYACNSAFKLFDLIFDARPTPCVGRGQDVSCPERSFVVVEPVPGSQKALE